jgi:hypothetical protein
MKQALNGPYAHLLRASPQLIAEMQRVCAESLRRDREEDAEREAQRISRAAKARAADIVRCNEVRMGHASLPVRLTKLARQILRADARRRGEDNGR